MDSKEIYYDGWYDGRNTTCVDGDPTHDWLVSESAASQDQEPESFGATCLSDATKMLVERDRKIEELELIRSQMQDDLNEMSAKHGNLAMQLAARPASIPEGWKLVPESPTEDMALAGFAEVDLFPVLLSDVQDAYRAMLSAAPTPAEEE